MVARALGVARRRDAHRLAPVPGRVPPRAGRDGAPDGHLRRPVPRVRRRWWELAAAGVSAGLGALVPVIGLLVYNQFATGHWFNPAYETLYQQEAGFYTFLNYNADWSIEDIRYIPANLGLMLVGPPDILPTALPFGQELCGAAHAVRGWLDPECPIVAPRAGRHEPPPHEPGLAPGRAAPCAGSAGTGS